MKIIDIINKMYKKEQLPKKIKYIDKIFYEQNGGYYTEIGDNIFNYIAEWMLNAEVEIL